MKKIILAFLALVLTQFITTINAEENNLSISDKSKSAVVIDLKGDLVIYSDNMNTRFPPASMTKMMSMMLILDSLDKSGASWETLVTTSANAASMGGSQIFLEPNEQMSIEDLFKSVAISSANDAVVSLAEYTYGSVTNFVNEMNKKVEEYGLKNTNFQNPTGLSAKDHYSSAYDMAIIASKLLQRHSDTVLKYSSMYESYIRENTDSPFWLVNTNKLVKHVEGIDGLKTGWTQEAGYCLTATKEQNGMRLISVVMGAKTTEDRSEDTVELLNYGFANWVSQLILEKGTKVGEIDNIKYKNINYDLLVGEDITKLVKNGNNELIKEFSLEMKQIDGIPKYFYNIYIDGKLYKSIEVKTSDELQENSLLGIIKEVGKLLF